MPTATMNHSKSPRPTDLGLPDKFSSFRDGQYEIADEGARCEKRFDGRSVPTGRGKTLIYITESILEGGRSAICTATKGLQDQIEHDFAGKVPMAIIKGKSNYNCFHRPGWTCEDGHSGKCPLKGSVNCGYSKAYFKALTSRLVLTNYAFWFSVHKFGLGLGKFNHLYLDEAHDSFDELSSAIQIRMGEVEVTDLLKQDWPKKKDDLVIWKAWAVPMRVIAAAKAKELQNKILSTRDAKQAWVKEFHHLRNIVRKLGTLSSIRPADWVVDEWEHGYLFDAIRPSRYAESMLFLGIPRVSFYSATIREKSLNMVGVWDKDEYEFHDYPSTFDPQSNPLIHVPTVYVDHNMTDSDVKRWIMRGDQFIQRRLDRKGLFQTTSYARRDQVLAESEWGKYMVSNYRDKGDITSRIVELFKKLPPPAILVSPSITTGYDFIHDMARFNILGKVPWPDGRSKLMKARQEYDPRYSQHITMQTLIQSHGRPKRADDDWSESLILDNHVSRFLTRNYDLAPKWFLDSYREEDALPPPPDL